MTKPVATRSTAHTPNFDKSPHLNLIPPESESVTQTVQVHHQKRRLRKPGWKEVNAALAHNLNCNFVTRSLAERVGSGDSFERADSPCRHELRKDVPIEPPETVILDLKFHKYNNRKTYAEPFVVVDELWIDLMLGKDLSKEAMIGRGLELGPFICTGETKKQTKADDEAEKLRKERLERELAYEDRLGQSQGMNARQNNNARQNSNAPQNSNASQEGNAANS